MTATTMAASGVEELIELIDHAVSETKVEDITQRVQQGLTRLIRQGSLRLPEDLCRVTPGHYARRLVHRSEEHGWVMVAMTWGPEQSTPLHDHAGTWCVEGVIDGAIEVAQFHLLEDDGELCHFVPMGTLCTGVGSAGALIPPYEYHIIANPDATSSAVTLHIYGEEMTECTSFEPAGSECKYRRTRRQLRYDA
ncbi:MAG: cysteine dioxygenase family protein [Acidobacteriota bacterium]